MRIPPSPRSRSGGLVAWLEEFYNAWKSSILLTSQDIEISETSNGLQGKVNFLKGGGDGGAAASPQPFTLQAADERDEDGDITENKVRILTSTLFGDVPDGFSPGDDPPYLFPVSDNDIVFAILNYDVSTGEITGRSFNAADELPEPEDGTLNIRIGSVKFDSDTDATKPVNDRYGPINGTICADWFANPTNYSATVTS